MTGQERYGRLLPLLLPEQRTPAYLDDWRVVQTALGLATSLDDFCLQHERLLLRSLADLLAPLVAQIDVLLAESSATISNQRTPTMSMPVTPQYVQQIKALVDTIAAANDPDAECSIHVHGTYVSVEMRSARVDPAAIMTALGAAPER